MALDNLIASIKEESRKDYIAVFEQDWPSWLAGIFIAVLALLIFLWDSPWGIAGGYRNWGNWVLYAVGMDDSKPFAPWLHPMSLSNFGIFIGAFFSAMMSRQFKIRKAPNLEYAKGIVGGVLMGTGAAFAGGCNVGGFYTATGMLSMGGIAMMVGLGGGAWIGLKYLLWEMEHIPAKPLTEKTGTGPFLGVDWDRVQPFIGGGVFLVVIAAFYLYSSIDKTVLGGLLFFGFLIGLVMHRSRFCFVRAFRCPFMTGEAEMVKVVAMSLIIYGMGSAVIKWAWIKEPITGVVHPFFLGSLVGGLIFGVGMILAGGCASSTLWRIGEGHLKLVMTLIGFSLANALTAMAIKVWNLSDKLGKGVFMPDVFTWELTIPLFILFFVGWAFIAIWNEDSEKFVIF
ncbi:MAG: YeeE/YedE thiosulfate transporter family protein [Pseudomonadota bacterium]